MPLRIVPVTQPSPKEAVKQRLKNAQRISGILECSRCGSRTAATIINGAIVNKGRVQGGTVIDRLVCDDCRKEGVIVPMLRELKQI